MRPAVMLLGVGLCGSAHADPFWARPPMVGHYLGLSLVSNLGPATDRARLGLSVDAATERIWQERPYYSDVPEQLTPVVRASASVGWTHPVVYTGLVAQAGALYPLEVFDGGYVTGVAGLGGAGLGMSTDGSAGPVVTTTLVGPYWVQAQLQASRWQGEWHAPRLTVGPRMQMNCCFTYN